MNNPVRFSEIIGHADVIERLGRDIAGGRMAHAYLFVGPAGVGKAAVARLFGAATLCKSADVANKPCGECLACGKIDRRNHPDFYVLEAESGKRWIRIDQVRELQAALSLRPFESDRRVVIIDCAENMNEAAQNSFLKTLEEPPAGTLIVLVTSAMHMLLPTIISRCRIERFGPLRVSELAPILMEKRGLSDREAALVASMSSGSVGAGLSMDLDFVNRIRPAFIARISEIADGKKIDPEKIIGFANQLMEVPEEAFSVIRLLMKDIAMKKLNLDIVSNIDRIDLIENLESKWEMKKIIEIFDATLQAEEGLSRNLHKAIVFENLVLRFAPEAAI